MQETIVGWNADKCSFVKRVGTKQRKYQKPFELIGVDLKQFHSREQKAALATKLRSWKSAILFNARSIVSSPCIMHVRIHRREYFLSSIPTTLNNSEPQHAVYNLRETSSVDTIRYR